MKGISNGYFPILHELKMLEFEKICIENTFLSTQRIHQFNRKIDKIIVYYFHFKEI